MNMLIEQQKKYNNNDLITFGLTIKHKFKNENWKKELILPKAWNNLKLNNKSLKSSHNGLGMLTGEINNIFVVDIDDVDDWNYLLKETNNKEPCTVKAISGSGGIHLYFKYDNKLKDITSKDKAICYNGKKLKIDVKNNGGFIIVAPSTYYNENIKKNVEYKWCMSIIGNEPLALPKWLEKLFIEKQNNVEKINIEIENDSVNSNNNTILDDEYEQTDFTDNDIKKLCSFLSTNRMNSYKTWTELGMCLKNLSDSYLKLWINSSKKSKDFNEQECKDKWKTFRRTKNGLKIGSLIKWTMDDNKIKCKEFLKERNIKSFVEKNKDMFPDNELEITNIITNDDYHHITLKDRYCPMYEDEHKNNNIFLELTPYELVMKCHECIGKKYPCKHIRPNAKEIKQLFNIKIDKVTINNYYGDMQKDTEIIEIDNINIVDDEVLNKLIIKSLNGTHYDIAEVLFYIIKKDFIFGEKDTDSDDKVWYEFRNNRWIKSVRLRNMISKVMPEKYEKIINEYKKIKISENADQIDNKIKKITSIINSLKTSSTKNSIMTELEELSQVDSDCNFYEKLDSKLHLFGFNNGVYDFKKMEFRKGTPDDYISMTCGYDYIDTYTNKKNDLIKFLNDIQPDEKQLNYLLTYISTCLPGLNTEELFTILTGSGRNGKSKFISLLKKTFGDYFSSVSSKLFTRPRPDANAPDPGLLHLTKSRIVVSSESEIGDKYNSGFIKFLSGNDNALLRKCHGNTMINFKANFIIFCICNDIPEIDCMDNALSKRLRCIGFKTAFVENPKEPYEIKINKNIEQELDGYVQDFILILIEKYKIYINNNRELIATSAILELTNNYKEEVDIYYSFLSEKTEKSNQNIWMAELYSVFKGWYKNKFPGSKLPNNREFNNGIRKHKNIERSIKINNKVSTGIKKLKIIIDNDE
jgi:P4 family phage/plasmid primase-like protien